MRLQEREIPVPAVPDHEGLLAHLTGAMTRRFGHTAVPQRFVVAKTDEAGYHCEVGVVEGGGARAAAAPSIFTFERRAFERVDEFTAVFLVPTGIGAELGGHAGDAGPAARLLATAADRLVLHPNVVNASDINELPENALYVEGSVISRLLMGTLGLQPVRANRVLVLIDDHSDSLFVNAAVNAVSAARASYGLNVPAVVALDPPVAMKAYYTSSGSAVGVVEGLERVSQVLDEYRGQYDAVALSSVIQVPAEAHLTYFEKAGEMINPWGGVEAVLTHALSLFHEVPTAHSPMFENREVANIDAGVVDPRMAAEAVSLTFFQCILKGLMRSPRLVTNLEDTSAHGVITAADVSCLVIPDGCIGLPTLAALEQGIPVIAVRGNYNIMMNDLTSLPWSSGQLHVVENYLEAVGVMTALKAGLHPAAVRRPLTETRYERRTFVADDDHHDVRIEQPTKAVTRSHKG